MATFCQFLFGGLVRPLKMIKFNMIKLRVQIFGIPIEKQSRIGKGFGECHEVDTVERFGLHGRFKRVLVSFNLKSPITKEF